MGYGNAPQSSDSKPFWGAILDDSGANAMIPIKGVNAETQNEETVVALATQDENLNAAIGATDDSAAGSDGATASLLSLTKRLLGHLSSVISGIGATDAAVVTPGDAGSVNAKLRAISRDIGAITDTAATGGSTGSISAKLRAMTTWLAALNTVQGGTTDPAATAGGSGTISAKLRTATDLLNSIKTRLDGAFTSPGTFLLVDAEEIRDADPHVYHMTTSLQTATQMRQYSRWNVHVQHSHDKVAQIWIAWGHLVHGVTTFSHDNVIFTDAAALPAASVASPARRIYTGAATNRSDGTATPGVASAIIEVPALAYLTSGITIRVEYADAPTEGTLTVRLEGQ